MLDSNYARQQHLRQLLWMASDSSQTAKAILSPVDLRHVSSMTYLRQQQEDFEALREELILDRRADADRSCRDGYCGGLDCLTCRGDEALEFISAEEE